jgi:hypothetical protein
MRFALSHVKFQKCGTFATVMPWKCGLVGCAAYANRTAWRNSVSCARLITLFVTRMWQPNARTGLRLPKLHDACGSAPGAE